MVGFVREKLSQTKPDGQGADLRLRHSPYTGQACSCVQSTLRQRGMRSPRVPVDHGPDGTVAMAAALVRAYYRASVATPARHAGTGPRPRPLTPRHWC